MHDVKYSKAFSILGNLRELSYWQTVY